MATRSKDSSGLGADHQRDLYSWLVEQARLVRDGRWQAIDQDNLAKEIEGLAQQQFDQLESAARLRRCRGLCRGYERGTRRRFLGEHTLPRVDVDLRELAVQPQPVPAGLASDGIAEAEGGLPALDAARTEAVHAPEYAAVQHDTGRLFRHADPRDRDGERARLVGGAFTALTLFSTALQSLVISAAPSERASSSPAPAPFDNDSTKPARWLTWPDQTGILFFSSQARAFTTAGASF